MRLLNNDESSLCICIQNCCNAFVMSLIINVIISSAVAGKIPIAILLKLKIANKAFKTANRKNANANIK